MKIQNKNAVSEVVSVVLIIMITVAAVAVLWTIVIPMVQNSLKAGSSCFDAGSDVTLVQEGYTCLNANGSISLQIQKGSNGAVKLKSVQVIVSLANGNTNSTELAEGVSTLGANDAKVFLIDGNYTGATEIKIAPILVSGKTEKRCDPTQKAVLLPC